MRIRLSAVGGLAILLTGCGFTLAPPGFVRENRHAVCRGWFDWNSHHQCSFTFETYDRLPPESSRVKLFRWSHGASVDKPREVTWSEKAVSSEVMVGDQTPTPAESQNNSSSNSSVGDGSERMEILPPPPAPPSEMPDSESMNNVDPVKIPEDDPSVWDRNQEKAVPVVKLSFSENLSEGEMDNSMRTPECGAPEGIAPISE